MQITEQIKEQIVQAAEAYIQTTGISNRQFADLAKVNPSYFSAMVNRKWNEVQAGDKTVAIADKYFIQTAKAAGHALTVQGWGHFDTVNYLYCMQTFDEARHTKMPKVLDGETGSGRSYAATMYKQQHPQETYIVTACGDLTSKGLLIEIAEAVKSETIGSGSRLRKGIVARLLKDANPLLIIDESENLKDGAWDSIKTMMDALKGHCGIVIIGANRFEQTIRAKSDRMQRNFPQIYRRMKEGGIKKLVPFELTDVRDICIDLGISDVKVQQLLFDHCRNLGELSGAISNVLRECASDAVTAQKVKRILDL